LPGRPACNPMTATAVNVCHETSVVGHRYIFMDITHPYGMMQAVVREPLIHGNAAVPCDRLLDLLIDFFNRLPAVVRGEASLLIVALSTDEFIDLNEEFDFE
jgi:hypothetical protein